MPTTCAELANWIANHFAVNQQRTADVLAGPKREAWFSAETFSALCHAAPPDPSVPELPVFSCWGEDAFRSIFERVDAALPTPLGAQPRRRPDVVCYLPQNGPNAIDAIIELKLIINDENSSAALEDLRSQLQNARVFSSTAKVLGLIFVAMAPFTTPGTFDSIVRLLRSQIENSLPQAQGFRWVPGHEFMPVFRTVQTGFERYPSMSVSLSLGAIELVLISVGLLSQDPCC